MSILSFLPFNYALICLVFSSTTYNFKEHGSYGWNISATHLCSDIYVLREPRESYLRKLLTLRRLVPLIINREILIINCFCSNLCSLYDKPYINTLVGNTEVHYKGDKQKVVTKQCSRCKYKQQNYLLLVSITLLRLILSQDLDRLQETESTTHPVIRTTKSSTRIRSVDTFRGYL